LQATSVAGGRKCGKCPVLWRKRKETKASIANKLARSTLTAAFFLACLAALELEGVALDQI
jgi:Domain of unknown function (DUF6471)